MYSLLICEENPQGLMTAGMALAPSPQVLCVCEEALKQAKDLAPGRPSPAPLGCEAPWGCSLVYWVRIVLRNWFCRKLETIN